MAGSFECGLSLARTCTSAHHGIKLVYLMVVLYRTPTLCFILSPLLFEIHLCVLNFFFVESISQIILNPWLSFRKVS